MPRERVGGREFAKEEGTFERRGGEGEIKGTVVIEAKSLLGLARWLDTDTPRYPRDCPSHCLRVIFSVVGIASV